MGPNTTIWRLEPHTRGKHLVLRNYLDAWLPIRSKRNSRILFIDGFSGPGEYLDGEEGSPLIALRALYEHRAKGRITSEIRFIFIERDEERAAHLSSIVDGWRPSLPTNCAVQVVNGIFDGTMSGLLDQIEVQARRLAPSLVMLDPFGVSGTPMSVIERILSNSRSEVYISFMYESINRFKNTAEFAPHLDDLFGCADWRAGIGIEDPEERKTFFYGLYENQLRKSGATQVVHFDLYEGNRLVYAIFFGAKHTTGSDRMKQAIWKVAPFGEFAFRGTKSAQLTLGLESVDFEPLMKALHNRFYGDGLVGIKEVLKFVASDRTDFHTGQVKRTALIPMEKAGAIDVDDKTRNRIYTYPDGTKLRFIATG